MMRSMLLLLQHDNEERSDCHMNDSFTQEQGNVAASASPCKRASGCMPWTSAPHRRQSPTPAMQLRQKKWPQAIFTASKKRALHLQME